MAVATKFLLGVTHVIITAAATKKEAEETKVWAEADLCFTPNDEDSIAHLQYVKTEDGTMLWQPPHVTVAGTDGKTRLLPVFKGQTRKDVCNWAAHATDKLRKEKGGLHFGHRYRISKAGVEDLTPDHKEQN